jgi:selenocysteine lyase/cysteine desulfurase
MERWKNKSITMSLQTDIYSEKLSRHYKKFDVANRLLFTGHSHQAWPDIALDGLLEGFDVAARLVDTKWDRVFEKIEIMRSYLRKYYDDPNGSYTHCENTHHLIVRWLSALDLKNKPRLITTDTEFYSLYRQLSRLEEEGIEVVYVPALPLEGFADRLKSELTNKTAGVMISRVYFENGLVNIELPQVAVHCRDAGIPLMIDDYHGTNVVPLSIREAGLEDCYLLIGGYKYLQWGEGNCFLRFPEDCELRPVVTGWFASFSSLKEPRSSGKVRYDSRDWRFYGATFDGISAFRGAAVTDFFNEYEINSKILSKIYREQIAYMKYKFLKLDLSPSEIKLAHTYSITLNGGFLALRSPKASEYYEKLKVNGVLTDCRGDILRLGPAPYTVSRQIDEALDILAKIVKKEL